MPPTPCTPTHWTSGDPTPLRPTGHHQWLDPHTPSAMASPPLDLLHMAPTSHLPDETGRRRCHNSSTRHDNLDAINHLRKASADETCPKAIPFTSKEAPQWPRGLRRLPRRSSLTYRSTGARVAHPPKPTNSLELGWEPLSSGPNEGLHSSLDALPLPRSMAVEGRP